MSKVHTFWAKSGALVETENYREIYNLMPDFRKDKADRIHFAEDRAMSVGAWYLYMKARAYLGISEELPFNLSHSGGYVLVSIGPKGEQVGCDLEVVKDCKGKLAKRYFRPAEYAYIMGRPEAERAEIFYRYWVLKESFMKATGQGMKLGLDTFELELGAERPHLTHMPQGIPGPYYFEDSRIEEGKACVAICSTCSRIEKPVQIKLI